MAANNEIDMSNFEVVSTNAAGFIQELKDKQTGIRIKKEKRNSPFSIVNPSFDKLKDYICNENEIYIGSNLTFINKVEKSKINKYGCFHLYNNNQSTSSKTIEIIINGLVTKTKIEYKNVLIDITLFDNQGYQINDAYLYDSLKLVTKEKLQELKKYLIQINTTFVIDLYLNRDFERTYKLFNGENKEEYIEIE